MSIPFLFDSEINYCNMDNNSGFWWSYVHRNYKNLIITNKSNPCFFLVREL